MIRKRIVMSGLMAVLMLAVSVATPMVSAEAEPEAVYADDPGYGLLPIMMWAGYTGAQVIAAFVGGVIMGALATKVLAPNETTSAGDNEEIYKLAREMYATGRMDAINTTMWMATSMLPADTSLWAHTTNYWARNSELVVAALWSENGTFRADKVYELTLMRENIENYIYDWQTAIDKNYNNNFDARNYFSGDCYGTLEYSIVWDQGSIRASNDGDIPFIFDITQIVQNAEIGQYVWIDCNGKDDGGSYAGTSQTLYNFGTGALTLTKMSVLDGDSVGNTISVPGKSSISLAGKTDGLYRIDSPDASFAGPVTRSATDNSANVGGALVIQSGSEMIYAIPDGEVLNIYTLDGLVYSNSTMRINLSYAGTNSGVCSSDICDGTGTNLIRDWDKLLRQIFEVQKRSIDAGEAIWGIFDVAEESNSLLSPSSVTSSVVDVNLSPVEQQSIYMQAMIQIADYWENNGDKLTEAEFTTTLESTDLVVYGDLYYNGDLWMENVIFTPYLTVSSEQVLTVGEMTDWSGPGFAMVWAQEENYGYWDKRTTAGEQLLISLDSSYSIDVKRIEKEQKSIDTITLAPTVIKKFSKDPVSPTPPATPPKVLDASTLILAILIELAAILFLICYIFGQPVTGLILALIVLAVAVICPDIIASVLLGTFSWTDLLGSFVRG